MKYLAFLCLFIANSVFAQSHQGTIRYERKLDVHRRLQDEQMKAMVPQFQIASYDLLFNDSISVYKAVPKDEAPDPFENSGGGAHVIMKFNGPGDDGMLYQNYHSGRLLEETSLEEKKYLITDSIRTLPWKLSEETGAILGHPCKKATATTPRGNKLVAWYSEDIAVPVGPDKTGGLPGAILKLDIDSAGVVYTATQIVPSVNAKDLRAPTGNKAVTRAEYEKILDQVMGPADAQGRRMTRRIN
jgi:GLPGLI family protein